jgi:hypothetical protein
MAAKSDVHDRFDPPPFLDGASLGGPLQQ